MANILETIPDTMIGPSAHNENGLFTRVSRSRGDVLCHLQGEVVKHDNDNALLLATEWNALDDDTILLRRAQTSYYFINHSRLPNLTIDPITHALVAKTDIASGDELLLDYLENGFPQSYLQTESCSYLR